MFSGYLAAAGWHRDLLAGTARDSSVGYAKQAAAALHQSAAYVAKIDSER